MSIPSFAQIRQCASKLPSDFFGVDALVAWRPKENLIPCWNSGLFPLSRLNLDNLIAAVLRLAAAIFALPFFSLMGSCYHLALGLGHIILAFAVKARPAEEGLTHQDAKGHARQGLQHLILAVYNFALQLPVIRMAVAVSFAIDPQETRFWHDQFHNGWVETKAPTETEPNPAPVRHKAVSLLWAEKGADALMPNPVEVSPQPPPKSWWWAWWPF